jgi:type 1 glutamine amidotransferase
MRITLRVAACLAFASMALVGLPQECRAAGNKVLVYTRNYTPDGKGYVHENIAASVAAIRKMGSENGFEVDVTDQPRVFDPATLKQYRVLVFSNSNNEAFENDAQREAFKAYIKSGGGIVGIHSATGSERSWPYFWQVMGGKFTRHPKLQPFTVQVTDPSFPGAKQLPATFQWEDECYYHDHLSADIKPVLVTNPGKLDDPQFSRDPGGLVNGVRPLAWYQTFDGGREFYTALGHKPEDYAKPLLYNHILGGILWAMGQAK